MSRVGVLAVMLAGCSGGDAPTSIAGIYSVTTSPCLASPTVQLVLNPDGSLLLRAGLPIVLAETSVGVYDGVRGTSTCVQSDQSYLFYYEGHVRETSATTVHVETAGASQRVSPGPGCSDQDALSLASQATHCAYDGTIEERAPVITDIAPATIHRTDCTREVSIRGGGFLDGARVGYEMTGVFGPPATENCAPWNASDGNSACDLIVTSVKPTAITTHLDPNSWSPYPCFGPGTLQLVVKNPDAPDHGGQQTYVQLDLAE